MEIVVDLMERKLFIEGEEQACICKSEDMFGDKMPELGTHRGCGNIIRLILVAAGLEEDFKIPIKKIKIYPEIGTEKWEGQQGKVDSTKVEFWSDDLVQEMYWLAMRNIVQVLGRAKDNFNGNLQELWNKNGGKACRGFDIKYIPIGKKLVSEIKEEDRKAAQEMVDKLSWEEIDAKMKEMNFASTRVLVRENPPPRTPYLDKLRVASKETFQETTVASKTENEASESPEIPLKIDGKSSKE